MATKNDSSSKGRPGRVRADGEAARKQVKRVLEDVNEHLAAAIDIIDGVDVEEGLTCGQCNGLHLIVRRAIELASPLERSVPAVCDIRFVRLVHGASYILRLGDMNQGDGLLDSAGLDVSVCRLLSETLGQAHSIIYKAWDEHTPPLKAVA